LGSTFQIRTIPLKQRVLQIGNEVSNGPKRLQVKLGKEEEIVGETSGFIPRYSKTIPQREKGGVKAEGGNFFQTQAGRNTAYIMERQRKTTEGKERDQ